MNARKIDCIMISKPEGPRFELFKASVRDFCRQKYSEKRLLVLLNNSSDFAMNRASAYLKSLNRQDIVVKILGRGFSLGKLRNLGIRLSEAPLLCQWDDDDRHGIERLNYQEECLSASGADAVVLGEMQMVFPNSRVKHHIRWRVGLRGMPCTVLFKRSVNCMYPNRGKESLRGEDTAFLKRLARNGNPVAVLGGHPELYTYVVHRQNQWPMSHYQKILKFNEVEKKMLSQAGD